MTARGFRSPTCRRGHPWTAATTYTQRNGKRTCRRCATENTAARRAAERAEAGPAPLPVLRAPGWMAQALCAQADPEAWFPEPGGNAQQAKRVCASCPVRVRCLEFALANGERFGVWGGLSERERRRVAAGRRAA